MGFRLVVIVSKCPRLKNVHKCNGRSSVYTITKIVCVCMGGGGL